MADTFAFDEVEHIYTLNDKPLMGVTSVLGVIAKPALVPWAAKMTVEYVGDHIEQCIVDGKLDEGALATMLLDAKNAHRKKKEDAGEKGTDLHTLAEGYIRLCIQENNGQPMEVCPAGIERLRDWAKTNKVTFLASEKKMYSKTWWIAGTCDLVFEKEGKKFVADIKTYAKIWDRVPFFQCAGYASMLEEMGEKKPIAGYCILRLSKDGSFEEKWSFDTIGDTKAFFACVELYRQLKTFNVK